MNESDGQMQISSHRIIAQPEPTIPKQNKLKAKGKLNKKQLKRAKLSHQSRIPAHLKVFIGAILVLLLLTIPVVYFAKSSTASQPSSKGVQNDKFSQISDSNNHKAQSTQQTPDLDIATDTNLKKLELSKDKWQNNQSSIDHAGQITKIVWLYAGDKMTPHSDGMISSNQRYFAQAAKFELQYISETNYSTLVSSKTVTNIQNALNLSRGQEGEWTKALIMLGVLLQKGGVMLYNSDMVFSESLEWIERIDQNPHVNRGKRKKPTQVIAFFNPRMSGHDPVKVTDIGEALTDPLKNIWPHPVMLPALIAAKPGAQFIKRLWYELQKSLTDRRYFSKPNIPGTNFRLRVDRPKFDDNFFGYVALRAILTESQKVTKNVNIKEQMVDTIEQYGLSLINSYYGPDKLAKQMPFRLEPLWRHMADMDIKQVVTYFGRFRYCYRFPGIRGFNQQMGKLVRKQIKVVRGSLLHQTLLVDPQFEEHLEENKERPVANQTAPQWNSLPRKVWVIWDSGIQNTKAVHQLSIANIRRKVAESGFSLYFVSQNNVKDYLDKDVIDRINFAISHPSGAKFKHTWPDMVRIALLYKYGGVYIDTTFILVDNFDWILNIARYPSQYIYNRYGELPKILGTFHPWWSTPVQWQVDEQANTKYELTLAPQNNFVAVQAQNEFIKQWFDAYLNNFQRPYAQTKRDFDSYGVTRHKWTSQGNTYLLSMDSMKMVLCRRQVNLPSGYRNAMEYYKMWSFHGYMGPQNYRNDFNLQNPDDQRLNIFLMEYSTKYVKQLAGQTPHAFKLYGNDVIAVDGYIMKNYPHNIKNFHPQSFIAKHLLDRKPTISRVGGRVKVTFDDQN